MLKDNGFVCYDAYLWLEDNCHDTADVSNFVKKYFFQGDMAIL